MAISWGSYGPVGMPGGYEFRAGLDITYSPTSVTALTTSVEVTVRGYLGAEAYSNGTNGRYELTGDITLSDEGWDWSIATNGGSDHILTSKKTITLLYGNTQSFSVSLRIRPSLTWGGYTPTKTRSITIPARPVNKPSAPTALAATYNSDSSISLAWDFSDPASAPVDNVQLYAAVDGGALSKVGDLGAVKTAGYTSSKGHRYEFRVRAENDAGVSSWSSSEYCSTTPPTPPAPAVEPYSSTSVKVVIADPSTWPAVVNEAEIHREVDGIWGGLPIATLSTSSSFITTVQAGHTYRYRVIYVSTDPVLFSTPGAATAAEPAISPPAKPTDLSPDGATVDATLGPVPVSYTYNSTDGTPQRARQLRLRSSSTAPWTTLPVETTSSTTDGSLQLEEGKVYEWQVTTWGESTTASPWSNSAYITTLSTPLSPPVFTALSPSGPAVEAEFAQLTWDYEQPEGSPQGSWNIEVKEGTTVVASASGVGASTRSWNTPAVLEPGSTYTWSVWGADETGVASTVSSATFTVSGAPSPERRDPVYLPAPETTHVTQVKLREHTHHTASIFEKGGRKRLFDLDAVKLYRWSRELDETSEATIRLTPPLADCGPRLAEILPMRHELVIFYDGKRTWEGPITLVKDTPGAFEIKAKDVSFYLNRMVMREEYRSRLPSGQAESSLVRMERIIRTEGARFEDSNLPINILPYLQIFTGLSDPETTRTTEAGEKYVYEELDDLAWRGGIDFGVAGRMIYIMDTDTPVGEIRRMTSEDFTEEVEVVMYGSELATEAYVTDRQGRFVSHGPGESRYYGRVELLHGNYAEGDDPDAAAAVPIEEMMDQAGRDFAPRYPLPMAVRVPQNVGLQHQVFNELFNSLFPGVRVPLTAEGTVHNVSRMMKLKNMKVEESDDGVSSSVTLVPASEAAALIGGE